MKLFKSHDYSRDLLPTSFSSAGRGCRLDDVKVVDLQYNATTGNFDVISRRLGQPTNDVQQVKLGSHPDRLLVEPGQIYHARSCWCAVRQNQDAEYCLLKYTDCSVNAYGNQVCLNHNQAVNIARGLAPAMIFFWCCVAYCFIVSEPGASARAFLYRKLWSKCGRDKEKDQLLLEQSTDRLQARNPDRAALLFRFAIRRLRNERRIREAREEREQERELQEGNPSMPGVVANDTGGGNQTETTQGNILDTNTHNQPTDPCVAVGGEAKQIKQLALKTKSFQGPERKASEPKPSWNLMNQFRMTLSADDDDNDDDETHCAICITLLETGDRVGDLPCGHNFHVRCLKRWLKRKNQCPLCSRDHVAELQVCEVPKDDEQPSTLSTI